MKRLAVLLTIASCALGGCGKKSATPTTTTSTTNTTTSTTTAAPDTSTHALSAAKVKKAIDDPCDVFDSDKLEAATSAGFLSSQLETFDDQTSDCKFDVDHGTISVGVQTVAVTDGKGQCEPGGDTQGGAAELQGVAGDYSCGSYEQGDANGPLEFSFSIYKGTALIQVNGSVSITPEKAYPIFKAAGLEAYKELS